MSLQDVDPETRAKAETEKADGNNLYRSRDFDGAISAYKRAFSLNPDPIYLNNLAACYFEKGDYDECIKQCERAVEEAEEERKAYINPELSDKSREEGNTCFKNGDFATAVKHYTESVKRNPSDPRAYTNRAASNSKLPALPEALKDTDSAIEVNPNFTKAYIRKALTLLAMKDCRHNRSYS
ncbi:hypothetical protein BY996DRAFT_6416756 [Phakopsora pachyrhizi]|nr:hypothetical protein BY996DRAFT_6416756 [Phakopsora pachyrhizi]